MRRPAVSNLLAVLALFVALGGTTYAATKIPNGSVGSKQLKRNAVASSKIKDRSLTRQHLKPGKFPGGRASRKGATGATGPRGTTGPSGPTGQSGSTGASGPTGASGFSPQGTTGARGVAGSGGTTVFMNRVTDVSGPSNMVSVVEDKVLIEADGFTYVDAETPPGSSSAFGDLSATVIGARESGQTFTFQVWAKDGGLQGECSLVTNANLPSQTCTSFHNGNVGAGSEIYGRTMVAGPGSDDFQADVSFAFTLTTG